MKVWHLPDFGQGFCWVDDGLNKACVCLTSNLLAARPGVGLDDVGDVVVFLGSQMEELEPVG